MPTTKQKTPGQTKRSAAHARISGVPEAAQGWAIAHYAPKFTTNAARVCVLVAPQARELPRLLTEAHMFTRAHHPGARVHLHQWKALATMQGPAQFEAACEQARILETLTSLHEEEQTREAQKANKKTKESDTTPAAPTLHIIGTTLEGLVQPLPGAASNQEDEATPAGGITLKPGQHINITALAQQLADMGYSNEALCENPGECALRGGILDVYPTNLAAPVRIDCFGDELESLRSFSPTSQRTLNGADANLPQLHITPVHHVTGALAASGGLMEMVSANETEKNATPTPTPTPTLLTFLHNNFNANTEHNPLNVPPNTLNAYLTFIEPSACMHHAAKENTQAGASAAAAYIETHLANTPTTVIETLAAEDGPLTFLPASKAEDAHVRTTGLYACADTRRFNFAQYIEKNPTGNNPTEGNASNKNKKNTNAETFYAVLSSQARLNQVECYTDNNPGPTDTNQLTFIEGTLQRGFITPSGVYLGERELFGHASSNPRPANLKGRLKVERSKVEQLLDFSALAPGDFLVHLQNGICRFVGLQTLETGGAAREVVSVEFAGGITLHVPLHEAHLLSRYIGMGSKKPKPSKLGSGLWEKARGAAEKGAFDFASHLLRMEAQRTTHPGFAFNESALGNTCAQWNAWQTQFEAAFEYTLTPDQAAAIKDVHADMHQPKPMDRLLCGDVGFGKTEVALRAAFKAVRAGKQVAVLVPTTVLCAQHARTFAQRFGGLPITVRALSRLQGTKAAREALQGLANGSVDIVVGTHRLLGKAVEFNDLGLVVIDEEHRFGVKHKEALKSLRLNVDVLSMSATPIPRTLYMALVGARCLSTIETPPKQRLGVETIAKSYNFENITSAIQFELNRAGQVFYLHNRVQSIQQTAEELRAALPGARIAVGHGQMDEKLLERIMAQFVEGEIDILVCTTIIENGLDIPNCNTLIIEGADRFGLAQLYQLRGRVGRSTRQAYAYLFLRRFGSVLQGARERLSAMKQHANPGAGFSIAMKDLELRGCGHILGSKQSGHISGVGFELYCELLRQSIAVIKGGRAPVRMRANLKLDFIVQGDTGLGADTVNSGEDALETTPASTPIYHGYQILKDAEADTNEGAGAVSSAAAAIPKTYLPEVRLRIEAYRDLALARSLEALKALTETFTDRYGPMPAEMKTLIACARVRIAAEAAGVAQVQTEGAALKCKLTPQSMQHKKQAGAPAEPYLKAGARFPRLTAKRPGPKLKEIEQFLKRHALETKHTA